MEGSITTNLVSHGPNKTDKDLELTYIFEWNLPEIEDSIDAQVKAQDAIDNVGSGTKLPLSAGRLTAYVHRRLL